MKLKSLFVLTAACCLLVASTANAASIVLTRAGIAATDSLDWGVLGASFTVVANGTSSPTIGGTDTVTMTTSTATSMERRDQGNGWAGGFANGAHLLWTRDVDTASLILTFATPVLAAGADISADAFGDFTGSVTAFRGATNLGTFSVAGNNTANVPFLGVFDSLGITRLVFNVDNNTKDFAIDTLSIRAVPEPATLGLCGAGLLALLRRRQAARR